MSDTCPNCGSEDSEEGWSCGSYYEGYYITEDKIETRLIESPNCIRIQLDRLKAALTNLMPFVLEDYWPSCGTPVYVAAVETAKRLIE